MTDADNRLALIIFLTMAFVTRSEAVFRLSKSNAFAFFLVAALNELKSATRSIGEWNWFAGWFMDPFLHAVCPRCG